MPRNDKLLALGASRVYPVIEIDKIDLEWVYPQTIRLHIALGGLKLGLGRGSDWVLMWICLDFPNIHRTCCLENLIGATLQTREHSLPLCQCNELVLLRENAHQETSVHGFKSQQGYCYCVASLS